MVGFIWSKSVDERFLCSSFPSVLLPPLAGLAAVNLVWTFIQVEKEPHFGLVQVNKAGAKIPQTASG